MQSKTNKKRSYGRKVRMNQDTPSTCLTYLWKLWRNLNDWVMQDVGFYYMKTESNQPAEGPTPEK
jgi:hypothetical protein